MSRTPEIRRTLPPPAQSVPPPAQAATSVGRPAAAAVGAQMTTARQGAIPPLAGRGQPLAHGGENESLSARLRIAISKPPPAPDIDDAMTTEETLSRGRTRSRRRDLDVEVDEEEVLRDEEAAELAALDLNPSSTRSGPEAPSCSPTHWRALRSAPNPGMPPRPPIAPDAEEDDDDDDFEWVDVNLTSMLSETSPQYNIRSESPA